MNEKSSITIELRKMWITDQTDMNVSIIFASLFWDISKEKHDK